MTSATLQPGRSSARQERAKQVTTGVPRTQRTPISGEKTSSGVGTLHTPALVTPASGPSAVVRPRVTGGGGGMDDNRDYPAID